MADEFKISVGEMTASGTDSVNQVGDNRALQHPPFLTTVRSDR